MPNHIKLDFKQKRDIFSDGDVGFEQEDEDRYEETYFLTDFKKGGIPIQPYIYIYISFTVIYQIKLVYKHSIHFVLWLRLKEEIYFFENMSTKEQNGLTLTIKKIHKLVHPNA